MLASVKLAKEITKFSLREAAGKSPHEGYIAIEKIRIRTPDAALALAWGMTQRSFRVRLACIQAAGRTARFPQILLPKLVAAVGDPDVAQEAVKALLHFPPTESISQALHQWAEPRETTPRCTKNSSSPTCSPSAPTTAATPPPSPKTAPPP